jgi:hypothetical protein
MSGGCENCLKVRFVKPEARGKSFCVTEREAFVVDENVGRFLNVTTTHREKTEVCDHPEELVTKRV